MRIDLAGSLARWLHSIDEEERTVWFDHPADVETYARNEWRAVITKLYQAEVAQAAAPERTVFALTGLMDLFDLLHVSELMEKFDQSLKGYLLVFFPGERTGTHTGSLMLASAGTTWASLFCLKSRGFLMQTRQLFLNDPLTWKLVNEGGLQQ